MSMPRIGLLKVLRYVLCLGLLVMSVPAQGQSPVQVEVSCKPFEANWVGVRPSGKSASAPFTRVADTTKDLKLQFPLAGVPRAPMYDIRVEYRGWFGRYAAQKDAVWINLDTESKAFNLQWEGYNWLVLTPLGLLVLVPVLTTLLLGRRSAALSERLEEAIEEKAAVLDSKNVSGPLPPLLGRELVTNRGERFEVLRVIGSGAMGAVMEAVPRGASQDPLVHWAIKVPFRPVLQEADSRRRFLREADICARLPHPGLVQVLDWGTFDATGYDDEPEWPFIVMELMEGRRLRDEIDATNRRGLPLERAMPWLWEMAAALGALHAAGVVHRDVKPENTFITSTGHVKIGDFGLAGRVDRHSMTQTGDALGTPLYMSPEHLEAQNTTPASDVFSLGIVAYEMLAGHPPFEAETSFALFNMMLSHDAIPLSRIRSTVPMEMEALVTAMMDRQANRRPSCGRVMQALETLMLERDTQGRR